ncbi:MAG: D-alanyl-D-alanine carboxypeptidase DacB [Shouchella clausii]|jgi:serine-type D-Ala-D-Ala carboxypeptidase (penicillin-binding protein 5/6)
MGKASTFVKISIIMIIILLALFKVADRKEPFSFFRTDEYASPYIYVMDRETGRVVYEQNAEAKVYPASLTKIMTTIVALEQMDDLSAVAPVDVETYHEMFANNASMAGFFAREEVTYRDLLYGTMLTSGGEAANSLAVHVGGNVENFVQMMNDKADELGLNGTHFTNPEGLHNEKQYTTASDMAKLLDYALNNNDFKTIFTAKTFQTTPTAEHPDGLLLQSTVLTFLHKEEQDRFDILGGKSGTTYEAGQCWATLGLVEDSEYISIVMGAPLKNISHPDRAQIADTLKLYRKIESSE